MGCHFVSCVFTRVAVISVPVCNWVDVLSRKILASMQLAFRDLGLPLVRKLSICAVVPHSATCCAWLAPEIEKCLAVVVRHRARSRRFSPHDVGKALS